MALRTDILPQATNRAKVLMIQIKLNKEPVELFKVLKFEGLSESGGQAKAMIADGLVKLNGEVEIRKRKKVVSGDIIEFDGQSYAVSLESP